MPGKFEYKKLSTKSGDRLMGVLKTRTSGGMKKATTYKKYLEGLKKATSGAKPLVSKAVSAAKATKYGKIALGIAAAGLTAKEYIRRKMDKSKKSKQQAARPIKRAEGTPDPRTEKPAGRRKKTYHDKTTLAKSERHPHSRLKTQKEYKAITDSPDYKKADYHTQNKMLKKHPTTMKRGGVPGYDTGKGIDLAKKHKTKLKDKITTGIGYATEMAKSIPTPTNPYFIKDQVKKAVSKFKEKRFKKKAKAAAASSRTITNILSGGRKGKPHSSPEGRKASAGRTIKRMIANRKKQWPVDRESLPRTTTGPASKHYKQYTSGGSVTVKTKIGKFFPTKTY